MNGEIGILVVSFGSSYERGRKKSIDQIEKEIHEAYPKYSLYRAFTSSRIIKGLQEKGIRINNVEEALGKMRNDGIKKVIVQPTFITHGLEYERMLRCIEEHKQGFELIYIGQPLLTSVTDYFEVIQALVDEMEAQREDEVILCMAHGVEHIMGVCYAALDYMFKARGYENIYVVTINGYPSLEEVMMHLSKKEYKYVRIVPFMLVAGYHVQKSIMEQVEENWTLKLKRAGYEVQCVLKGLGEYKKIREIYKKHIEVLIEAL